MFFILKPLLTPSLVSVTQTPTSCSKLGLLKPLTAQPSRTSISETRFDHRNLPTFLMLAISSPMFISIFFEGSEVCQMLNFDILNIFFSKQPLTRPADFFPGPSPTGQVGTRVPAGSRMSRPESSVKLEIFETIEQFFSKNF